MKIALDTNAIFTAQAGAARYVRGLLRGFKEIASPELDIVELAWEVENLRYDQPRRALKTVWRELAWAPLLAPVRLQREQVNLLHITAGLPIRAPKGLPKVETLLDCSVLRNPERYRPWQRWTGPGRLQRLKQAEKLICISRFTADEAVRLLGISSKNIEVTLLGNSFDPAASDIAETPPPFDLPGEFYLFVGSLEPGKNLALLREVYLLATARQRPLPPLLIVGSRREGTTSEGTAPADWVYAGALSDPALLYCYRRALALVFPSKYEGFGLPVLEAMSLGCPVICSPVASLPEVGGEAPCYVPLEAHAYLDAMRRLPTESAERRDRIELGRVQAAKFSWRDCAAKTLDVYRRFLG